MQNLNNKIFVISISIVIILAGISTVSAIDIKNEYKTSEEKNLDVSVETVTLYRYGLDGSVKPIVIEIEIDEEKDIYDTIEKKCEQLLEKDPEFQKLLDNNNSNYELLTRIKSRGRGIHFKIAPQIIWPIRFKLFPLLPPYIFRRVKIPIIYCRYPRDSQAYTEITPLIRGNTTTISGHHSVLTIGFYGFKWWIGCVSFLGFILRTGFTGFSLITRIKKL